MRAAVPAIERSGGGSVILVSSIWGKVGVAGATAYQATKGAIVLLAKATTAREGRPGEIAQAATYLASDESGYVTGTELVVDGGYTTC